ncbi:hypothetical protein CD30_14555 [Ureibacillus massiliensis 4400831 = CIP 108448 = CCUG 49529]|uniref:Uncharacterized protein n=1 Tax=Ureibacillus massiliensis 4400831 = CIP 108448 = CCUG 49529 TaxID=1211035 RepID=A0A0A3JSA9_9BACL|nr:hypothetical protein [Ureibacillus massiliensis]KGR89887.1 hypothetical protein CD30_14555 [Ureibacillus massiliensis 4400831 = CIP 108448 = CCUG 49529]
MTIKLKIEEVIFDTLYEADVWADSIASEIYGRIYDGYITPDYKVACSLAFRLASIDECRVYTRKIIKKGEKNRYEVYVTFNI